MNTMSGAEDLAFEFQPSLRDWLIFCDHYPALKRRAITIVSLRDTDNHRSLGQPTPVGCTGLEKSP
jgi:hypothetical protein